MGNITLVLLSVLLFLPEFGLSESQFKIIKDPKPNLKEKNFIRLEKVGEINEDLGNKEYLFRPYSAAMDRENNLFVYDPLQAKIFKFDADFKFIKSYGSVGKGPGEFSGTGRMHTVDLNVGLDGRLYGYDHMARKVLVFDTDLKYIDQIKIKPDLSFSFRIPVVDKEGNLIYQEFREDKLVVFNQKEKVLLTIMNKEKKKEYLFVEERIHDLRTNKVIPPMTNRPFKYGAHEISMEITQDAKLLVLFTNSGAFYVKDFKGMKAAPHFYIWPEQAIKKVKADYENDEIGNRLLFRRIFVDRDQCEFFYLGFGGIEDIGRYCIYKMDINGTLVGVLYIPFSDKELYPRLLLKQNNLFVMREDEKIVFYKEAKK